MSNIAAAFIFGYCNCSFIPDALPCGAVRCRRLL